MKREDVIRCDVCGHNLNGNHHGINNRKSLILPYRDPKLMHLTSVCICETCYYRLPYDLQREVKRVSENQSDHEIAGYLLTALREIRGAKKKMDLNKGQWLWVRNTRTKHSRFQREDSTDALNDNDGDYTIYIDGKIS